MGLIEFFVLVFVTVALAGITNWAIAKFIPLAPKVVITIVWGVAVLIIVVALARALGLLGYDPTIPKIRG